jgi:hypothetical protein
MLIRWKYQNLHAIVRPVYLIKQSIKNGGKYQNNGFQKNHKHIQSLNS